VGNGKNDGRLFPDLPHEKFPGLNPEGWAKKMSELEMDQIVNRDDQPLGEKKRKNIMGRKIKVIAEFPCLEGDLHMLQKIVILCRHFDDTIPRHIKSIPAFQMNSPALDVFLICNSLEEILDVHADPVVMDFSRIKQDLQIETP
jgi:hypothetical protein